METTTPQGLRRRDAGQPAPLGCLAGPGLPCPGLPCPARLAAPQAHRRSNTRTEPSADTEAKMPTPPQAMSYTWRVAWASDGLMCPGCGRAVVPAATRALSSGCQQR